MKSNPFETIRDVDSKGVYITSEMKNGYRFGTTLSELDFDVCVKNLDPHSTIPNFFFEKYEDWNKGLTLGVFDASKTSKSAVPIIPNKKRKFTEYFNEPNADIDNDKADAIMDMLCHYDEAISITVYENTMEFFGFEKIYKTHLSELKEKLGSKKVTIYSSPDSKYYIGFKASS